MKKIKLMTHVVVGYPNIASTIQIVKAMEEAGVDYVELQIPFSDPIADGPTIMKACDMALQNGVTVRDCLKVMKTLSAQVSIPLFFMGYYNSVFHYGVEKFCKAAKAAGAYGLIIPDIPPDEEEYEHFIKACMTHHLHQIRVVTPASSDERLKLNAQVADEFVYCVSHYGVTGSSASGRVGFRSYLKRINKYFKIPIAVGFGISSRKDVHMVEKYADIVVVGSAVLEIINTYARFDVAIKKINTLIKTLTNKEQIIF
ncbi:tryptophan synthase subunit alpha [Candidatus Roizmanbacteria bacterium CG_4_9_14_0_2_um_filter_39_13]|uniref:Tryptophan synthase alpha chain n=1 Tax=Candidatus Roizmanbacteria bacterium CG_4_9_14_0_2_um_filter_39_13 TaxID=1974839 RepID=A0A2M8EWU9_9BACT|nr:MAG: tryptophan synthase subunit alpha [Candidatus Roizmanbacteria bacterium CG_4_10_14_0_2_um_filter_39_12]PJC30342.1 MAG: tryptophan synthase subunit alpha [Candidatus Roizmanbacteria bacterium CG_4_9_14_0_2_um_filter_39_13]